MPPSTFASLIFLERWKNKVKNEVMLLHNQLFSKWRKYGCEYVAMITKHLIELLCIFLKGKKTNKITKFNNQINE